MVKEYDELMDISETEMIQMLNETSQLIAKHNINQLSSAAVAAQGSNSLSNNVEFWKWMGRNYSKSGIFKSNISMQQYIAKGVNNEEWMIKQLQGKGYEWDWMTAQRESIDNIFKTYDAGDVANRAASDVTERSILNGKTTDYQMKAYTGQSNPHLKNTPNDMTVVTNAEKLDAVKASGYESVEEFQDINTIKKSTNERLEQIKDGKAYPSYNFKNVAGTMAKAGLVGCIIGIGSESVISYNSWKRGELTDKDYLMEILKSGGDAGVTSGLTSGIMIPVSATITAAGASTVLTIPIAFVVGGAVNKIVAPCFGRGDYKKVLSKAKYYQSLENVYDDLINSMEYASAQYYDFVSHMSCQNEIHQELKRCDTEINKQLKDLYDSI